MGGTGGHSTNGKPVRLSGCDGVTQMHLQFGAWPHSDRIHCTWLVATTVYHGRGRFRAIRINLRTHGSNRYGADSL